MLGPSTDLTDQFRRAATSNAFTLKGSLTVDRATDGTGYLRRMADRFTIVATHDNQSAALINAIRGASGAIVGHGIPGRIVTGAGQNTRGALPFQRIDLSTRRIWEPVIERINKRGFSELTLCGCDVAAGTAGSDLLYEIAKVLHADVKAPTGLVLIGGSGRDPYLEPGADWKKATPISRPQDLPDVPSHHNPALVTAIWLRSGFEFVPIPLERVRSTHLEPMRVRDAIPLPPQETVRRVRFDAPILPIGVPSAGITGVFVLRFSDAADREQTRRFLIYNDRLLQDLESEGVYYYAAFDGAV